MNDNVFAGMMVADFLCAERDSLQQKLKLVTEERNVPSGEREGRSKILQQQIHVLNALCSKVYDYMEKEQEGETYHWE